MRPEANKALLFDLADALVRQWWTVVAGFCLGLAAAVAMLVGAASYLQVSTLREQLTARQSYGVALQDRLADLPALRQKLDGLQRQSDVIADRRQRQPSVLLVIEDLSGLLPDGVWLDRLTVSQQYVTMSGYAPDAEVLLGLIEAHESFSAAEFTAASRRELILTSEDEFVTDNV